MHADKSHDQKSESVSIADAQMQSVGESTFELPDNRSKTVTHRKVQEMANNSPHVKQSTEIQLMANKHAAKQQLPFQRKKNSTGLPDNLKSGIEGLSGYSMDDVTVHRNSAKPAQLQAHAYAQGTDIHLGPGQEKHLPHEAWHVVQQKQGRVRPTEQMKGKVDINDDTGLEKEADVMGAKALQGKWDKAVNPPIPTNEGNDVVQRRKVGKFGVEAEVHDGKFEISAPRDAEGASLIEDASVSFEEYVLADLNGAIKVTLDGEVKDTTHDTRSRRTYTVEFVQRAVDVELENIDDLGGVAAGWEQALVFWQAHIENDQALKTELGEWYALQQNWIGKQFRNREETPGVTPEVDAEIEEELDEEELGSQEALAAEKEVSEEANFNWTHDAFHTRITTESQDPIVSMQMTAGSTLLGLMEVYLETVSILSDGVQMRDAEPENAQIGRLMRIRSEEAPETAKLNNFTQLIKMYITGNSNTKDERERSYAKEYVTLMSRTSLDIVYQQLNDPAKAAFDGRVAAYLFEGPENPLLDKFGRTSNERLFVKDATKEDVTEITIEQLLLSIIKKRPDALNTGLVDDETAVEGEGDILVQNNLEGLGEINETGSEKSDKILEKYGLGNAGEMMAGIPGMIFENRGAELHNLSRMPELFYMLADSLHQVNVAHEEALAAQEALVQPQAPLPQPAQREKKCYLTTACVTERGLPDDCEELQILRKFRDEVIAPLPVGPDLIKCYYKQAPDIVKTIDNLRDRRSIYDQIYQIIEFCVDAIKDGYDTIALTAYCEMVMSLERVFGKNKSLE